LIQTYVTGTRWAIPLVGELVKYGPDPACTGLDMLTVDWPVLMGNLCTPVVDLRGY
jgi:hypothetical protein